MPEGLKVSKYGSEGNKFVIKARVASRECREQVEQQLVSSDEVNLFIEYMINKSGRLKQMLNKKCIYNEQAFYEKHLFNSICLKTVVKQILEKMMTERRLGKNLKGMNKSNLSQIENSVWSVVEREADLYQNELDYERERKKMAEELENRKREIEREIQKLSCAENDFMMTSG